MVTYVLRRVLSAISVIVVTLIASFGLFFLAPTDPAGAICGAKCPTERYQEIRRSLDLDEPVTTQVGAYLKGLVAGRTYTSGGVTIECWAPCLGYSYTLGQPVTKLMAQAVPVTVSIVLGAAVVYLTAGI